MMEVGRAKESEESVRRQEEGTSSKQRKLVEEYGGHDGDRGGGKSTRMDREGNRPEENTSSGSEYIP